jgi:ribosomal protein L11 methyltransferase
MSHSRQVARPSGNQTAEGALFELRVRVSETRADEVGDALILAGAGGVSHEASGRKVALVTHGEAHALQQIARILAKTEPGLAVAIAPATVAASWETAFMDHLGPVRVSRTLVLVPVDVDAALPIAKHSVFLERELAFGFGEHPTTRMAARAVERLCRAGAGRVFDMGTGSGVLAIVAARSGATSVGVDIDARAVAAAGRNATLNGVAGRCRFSKTPASRVTGVFDVAVANIALATLIGQAPVLARLVASTGTLLVTGILAEHASDVEVAYARVGFAVQSRKREGGYVLVAFVRAAVPKRRPSTRRVATAKKASPAPGQRDRKTSRTPRSR